MNIKFELIPESFRYFYLLTTDHTISGSLNTNWRSEFGHTKTGKGAKTQVSAKTQVIFLSRTVFTSMLKCSNKRLLEHKFAVSILDSCSKAAIRI